MIPKIIHYCWFGGKEEPDSVKRNILSWRKKCPDYQIIRWDEHNYDIEKNEYMLEAYKEKKWAFVSDFARLDIVYEYGGIYLDTDVELIGSFQTVLHNKYFLAIEKDHNPQSGNVFIHINTGLGFGAEKHNEIIKELLDEYEDTHFVVNNHMDLTPCTKRNSLPMEKYGFDYRDQLYQISGGIIYPSLYFCPYEYSTRKCIITENTISIHHYDESWKTKKQLIIDRLKNFMRKIFVRKINKF